MSLKRSVLITRAPSGISPVAAPKALGCTQTETSVQRPFSLTTQREPLLEGAIRLDERCRERARIVHDLHDTLFQGFLGASMILDQAVAQVPADSPIRPVLSRALHLVRRAVDEGRAAMRGVHRASPAPASLEENFSNLLNELKTGQGVRLRVFLHGKPQALNPVIREQLFLIGREAVVNALRHSEATKIEVEVQYLHDRLRLVVRDNGCGINPEALQKASNSHWGLRGMRERAESIGARFGIWSRTGAGTEVRVAVRPRLSEVLKAEQLEEEDDVVF